MAEPKMHKTDGVLVLDADPDLGSGLEGHELERARAQSLTTTFAAGLAFAAVAPSGAMLIIGMGLLVGIGVSCTTFGVVLPAVGRIATPEKRSMAMGVASGALLAVFSLVAQESAKPVTGAVGLYRNQQVAPTGPAAKLADGTPDLTGVWLGGGGVCDAANEIKRSVRSVVRIENRSGPYSCKPVNRLRYGWAE